MIDHWYDHGGDPTRTAWIIVLGYLAAAVASIGALRRADGRERRIWIIATVVLIALGINKQLDLQTWFTATLRHAARAGGWYEGRRALQRLFLLGLAATAAIAWLAAAVWLRRARTGVHVALAGLTLLGGFVLMRAISFHHLDAVLHDEILGLRLHVVLEACGTLITAAAAFAYRRSWRAASRPRSAADDYRSKHGYR